MSLVSFPLQGGEWYCAYCTGIFVWLLAFMTPLGLLHLEKPSDLFPAFCLYQLWKWQVYKSRQMIPTTCSAKYGEEEVHQATCTVATGTDPMIAWVASSSTNDHLAVFKVNNEGMHWGRGKIYALVRLYVTTTLQQIMWWLSANSFLSGREFTGEDTRTTIKF